MLLQLNCRGYAVAQHMQPEPAQYSHGPGVEQKTFMQPEQPLYAHHPGRFVYVRDRINGALFSAPYEPTRAVPDSFVFSAGRSDASWRVHKDQISIHMSVSLPLDDVAELWSVEVCNLSEGRERELDLFPCFSIGYMSWMHQGAEYSPELGGIIARSVTPYQKLEDYPRIKAFKDQTVLLHGDIPQAWETCRDRFEGEGGIQRPDAVTRGQLSNGNALYETPVAAFQYRLTLAPGERRHFRFVFAPVQNEKQASKLRDRYLSQHGFERSLQRVNEYLDAHRGCLSIKTPDPDYDQFVNHWLDRQVFYHGDANRLTTDPQTRNYLQDAMGMVYVDPQHSRRAILKTLTQQKEDGALPEGVMLNGDGKLKYINQIPHTDHCVWLPVALEAYLNETNDYALLNDTVICDHRSLTVLQRTTMAMRWLVNNRDSRGLSLIAQGDWCDPLNMAGYKGLGVSGWLTIGSAHALQLWGDIAAAAGHQDIAQEMAGAAAEFHQAAQRHLWDGDWFARGIADDGKAFGVNADQEGKIWLNPQSWSLISGVATEEQRRKIKRAVHQHLSTEFGPVVLAPAYTSMQEHIGRVTQKFPGSAENGSIYNHAAMFCIYALYLDADSDLAFEEIKRIVPSALDERVLQREQLPVFLPNYYRGAVKQFPRTAGRSSQLCHTGACSWLYRVTVEQMFGLRGTRAGLLVDPQLPAVWDHAHITRRFRGAVFSVELHRDPVVENPLIAVDGRPLATNLIENIQDGRHYQVSVTLPPAENLSTSADRDEKPMEAVGTPL
ncbi:MAG: NdvB protein [Pseudomonadota bacterium]